MKLRKKILPIILVAIIVFIQIPVTPMAATTHNIDSNGDYVLSELGLVNGDTLTIEPNLTVTLTGNLETTYSNVMIVCGEGVKLTIENVKIDNNTSYGVCALSFIGKDNTLTFSGTNTFKSGQQFAGIRVANTTMLTIGGTGTLNASSNWSGAGIGGDNGVSGGTITINSGTINASSATFGAGIGGGLSGKSGTVTINGGIINASGKNGTGIGNGSGGSGGTVIINDGTINSKSYTGAGIGSGAVIINGGTVKSSSDTGAGIGGNVTINKGTITATSSSSGAGIGGGSGASGGSLVINGGTVTAKSGNGGAGIGGGYRGNGGNVEINGGTVTATGGTNGAGIGGGSGDVDITGGSGGAITINGGSVTAIGSYASAGIGGGGSITKGGSGGKVIINGGTVRAEPGSSTSGTKGFGIGGGGVLVGYGRGASGSCVITGGSVNVIGGIGIVPSNGNASVYHTELILVDNDNNPVTSTLIKSGLGFDGSAIGYGKNGFITDAAGILHLYLPLGNASSAFGGNLYISEIKNNNSNKLTLSGDKAYAINYDLFNVSSEKGSSLALKDQDFSVNLIPNTGIILPNFITVTMSGTELEQGADYVYDKTTGSVSITNVSGDILITAISPYQTRTLTDNATGISVSGSISPDAVLTVGDMTLGEDTACDDIKQKLNNDEFVYIIGKDISLSHDFFGTPTVTIPVDTFYNGQTMTILHCDDTLKTYTSVVEDGKITFGVDKFSPFAVFIEYLAPTIQTDDATSIIGAILNGNLISDGTNAISERGFVYATTEDPVIGGEGVLKQAAGSGTGTFTVTLTDLLPNTTYYVRAYAKNNRGITYGETIMLQTDDSSSMLLGGVPVVQNPRNPDSGFPNTLVLVLAVLALLSHLVWIIPLLRRKMAGKSYSIR